jgi:hypothetical protein
MNARAAGLAAAAARVSDEVLFEAYEAADDASAFEVGFVDACRRDTDLAEHWRARLSDVPTAVDAYLHRFEKELAPGTVAAEDDFRKSRSLLDAWRDWTFPTYLSSSVRARLALLLLLDGARFLDAIERIPAQPIRSLAMAETLSPHAAATPATIVRLVPLAPSIVQNNRWNGRVSLLLLLERAVDWALQLRTRFAGAVRSAYSDATRRRASHAMAHVLLRIDIALGHIFDALLRRPDGLDAATAFGLHLVHRWLVAKALPLDFHVQEFGVAALVSALVRAGVANATVDQLAETLAESAPSDPEPVTVGGAAERTIHRSRIPALIVSVHLESARGALAAAASAALWVRYVELLAGRDQGIDLLVSHAGSGVDELALGRLLALAPDPAAAFKAAWSRLQPQRRRLRFRAADHTAANPSEHLLLVARMALRFLAPATSAIDLWAAIARATFRLVQDEPRILSGRASGQLPTLFALVPAVFGAGWPLAIQWAAPLFQANPRLVRDAASNIEANRVARLDVVSAFAQAGIDLPAVEADLDRWLEMGAHPHP